MQNMTDILLYLSLNDLNFQKNSAVHSIFNFFFKAITRGIERRQIAILYVNKSYRKELMTCLLLLDVGVL